MVVEIKGPVTKEKVIQAIDRLSKEKEKKSLRKHFGKLKRGLNSVTFQQNIRNEWD
jgi:hypothetical protein